MHVTETAPILRSFDEGLARAFYIDWLGFAVQFEHRFAPGMPLYMGITRGGLVLHLSEHTGDAAPGACVFVRMAGLDALLAELLARPHRDQRPQVEAVPWGRVLQLTDPFGNRLRLCES